MNNITVSNSHVLAQGDGSTIIECFMSDQSIWRCDMQGKNWVKTVPGTKELTALFNARGT